MRRPRVASFTLAAALLAASSAQVHAIDASDTRLLSSPAIAEEDVWPQPGCKWGARMDRVRAP